MSTLPSLLRSSREARGWTIERAASMAGCAVRTISRAELGESTPRLDLVVRLADLYGVDVDVFLHTPDGTQNRTVTLQKNQGDGTTAGKRSPVAPHKGE